MYKRQVVDSVARAEPESDSRSDSAGLQRRHRARATVGPPTRIRSADSKDCLLYTSDAADERSSVDLGGRRIIKKKKKKKKEKKKKKKRKRRNKEIKEKS